MRVGTIYMAWSKTVSGFNLIFLNWKGWGQGGKHAPEKNNACMWSTIICVPASAYTQPLNLFFLYLPLQVFHTDNHWLFYPSMKGAHVKITYSGND